ncbi:MAG: ABC transporter ATP-binding protein, partial [Bdellovibrio sp.]
FQTYALPIARSILRVVGFEAHEGRAIAILGPNGAGKTSTLSLLLGLRNPTSGQVRVMGLPPDHRQVKKQRATTPQELAFPEHLKVKELFELVGSRWQDVESFADELEFTRLQNRRTGGLSGGEKRKLGLLLAFSLKPRLLVLDEPTTGVDFESRRVLWSLLMRIKKQGMGLVFTTHDLREAEELCDDVMLMDGGKTLFQGPAEEIKKKVHFHRVRVESPGDLSQGEAILSAEQSKPGVWKLLVQDSDAWVKELVGKGTPFWGLEISQASLEEALQAIRREGMVGTHGV